MADCSLQKKSWQNSLSYRSSSVKPISMCAHSARQQGGVLAVESACEANWWIALCIAGSARSGSGGVLAVESAWEQHPFAPYAMPDHDAFGKPRKKKCCDVLEKNKNYAEIAGGRCNSYINRRFNRQVPYTGKPLKCWSCNNCEKTHGLAHY